MLGLHGHPAIELFTIFGLFFSKKETVGPTLKMYKILFMEHGRANKYNLKFFFG